MKSESTLVIPVPDAEPLVKPYRDQFDPGAALGVPAHITVLYPFIPPQQFTPGLFTRLARFFAECEPFEFTLAELRRFPAVLYLAPLPETPFRDLTQRVNTLFPEYPPYNGEFTDSIPHLTLAHLADRERLEQIGIDFQNQHGNHLPLGVQATEVSLMDNAVGAWQVRAAFRLGAGKRLANTPV